MTIHTVSATETAYRHTSCRRRGELLMAKLEIIIASMRPGRICLTIGEWFETHAKEHGGFDDIELVDLAEVNPGLARVRHRPVRDGWGSPEDLPNIDPGGRHLEKTPTWQRPSMPSAIGSRLGKPVHPAPG
jgi:hypothetical protein